MQWKGQVIDYCNVDVCRGDEMAEPAGDLQEHEKFQKHMAEAAEDAASVLRSLSNPSRLLILCQLVGGERSVGELEDLLGLGQAYVSQQLARLRGEGLVTARRDGRAMLYSLKDPRVQPVLEAIHAAFCPSDIAPHS